MKTLYLTAAAFAAMSTAAMAQLPPAAEGPESETIRLNGRVTAQCEITAADTATITSSLAGQDGFVSSTAGADILAALNTAQPVAWCSGNSNQMNLYRTMLTMGNGQTEADGFSKAVLYDVGIDFPTPTNGGFSYDEGTSDGQGAGPTVGRFGPTGAGETGTFVADNYGGFAYVTPAAGDDTSPSATGNSATFTTSPARLAAGDYTSDVTLTLTPGV